MSRRIVLLCIAFAILVTLYCEHAGAASKSIPIPARPAKHISRRPALKIDALMPPKKTIKVTPPSFIDEDENVFTMPSFTAPEAPHDYRSSKGLQIIPPTKKPRPWKVDPPNLEIYDSDSLDPDEFSESAVFDFLYEHNKHDEEVSCPVSRGAKESLSPSSFTSTPSPLSSPSPLSPSSSSSSSSSCSLSSSLSPTASTFAQSEHSKHIARFDFKSGAKMVEGIPVCTPRSFERKDLLFKTTLSTTFLATHLPTKSTVLRKDILADNLKEFQIQSLVAEKSGYAPHVYCVEYHAEDHFYLQKEFTSKMQKKTLKKLNLSDSAQPVTIYMEYCCGGDMLSVMSTWDNDSSPHHDTIRKWMLQTYDAINTMHDLAKLHLDIKPENLAINCRGGVMLIDFGFAETRKEGLILSIVKGTRPYVAPEVYSKRVDFHTDYYAFGVMLAGMFELHRDFTTIEELEFEQTPKSIRTLIFQLTDSYSERVKAWSTLPEHPFFKLQS